MLSGAPEHTIQALRDYGYNLGMAFQILDDILDFNGLRVEIGKPVGNDLSQGILTLPAIMAMERCPEDDSIRNLFENPGDVESMRRVMDRIVGGSILEDSYDVAREYCWRALDSLEGLESNPARLALQNLVTYVIKGRN